MSRKIIHLTPVSGLNIAVHADSIAGIQEGHSGNQERKTFVWLASSSIWVKEPYPTVLRLWANALSSED